jgi:hypothetical protein
MAQSFYSIDLKDPTFPLMSDQQTRTVISETGKTANTGSNSPGISYCHNVMPTVNGLDSISYLLMVTASLVLPAGRVFVDARVIYNSDRTRLYIAWDDNGDAYTLYSPSDSWQAVTPTVPITTDNHFSAESVTTATVNGITYIFYSAIGAFVLNASTNVLDSTELTGLDIASVVGLVASSGYLIAYTVEAIAWSSTIAPTDFVPSTVTGAGGGNVAGIAGNILFCTANSLGIFIFTVANTLAGTYTGNTQFPFKIREVEDSEGGVGLDLTAYEANSGKQFAYTKAGLQSLSSRKAEIILPEVTDFLAGGRFEEYDEVTGQYTITDLPAGTTMKKKIKYISARYLVISYGITSFTHALVYDVGLQRLGKLKIDHADCFEYIANQDEVSKESIAFLSSLGEVKVVDFSISSESAGVLILGKVQGTRSRLITLLGVELENIKEGSELSVGTQAAIDGKNFTNVAGTLRYIDTDIREYAFRSTAKNHSLTFIGQFNLVTALVRYTINGRR